MSAHGATYSPQRGQFTITLACHRCGATGHSVWEQNPVPDIEAQPILVSLSDGFYERLSKKSPYAIELICHKCGAVQLG